ncbi:hypothetical protein BCV70DRAFT_53571 [Testicularia cyperi]|uniref:Uncharacterized protein n=1 Tax=Testicularia cyperi TaxID=1882483 RepID=A0A317XVL6_9BASI|nr:hypothetical protein BCV70DRAFT_53571 [Testicularia cyperi]
MLGSKDEVDAENNARYSTRVSSSEERSMKYFNRPHPLTDRGEICPALPCHAMPCQAQTRHAAQGPRPTVTSSVAVLFGTLFSFFSLSPLHLPKCHRPRLAQCCPYVKIHVPGLACRNDIETSQAPSWLAWLLVQHRPTYASAVTALAVLSAAWQHPSICLRMCIRKGSSTSRERERFKGLRCGVSSWSTRPNGTACPGKERSCETRRSCSPLFIGPSAHDLGRPHSSLLFLSPKRPCIPIAAASVSASVYARIVSACGATKTTDTRPFVVLVLIRPCPQRMAWKAK